MARLVHAALFALAPSLAVAACGSRTGLGVLAGPEDAAPEASVDASSPRDAAREARPDALVDARPDVLVLDPICVWPDGGLLGTTCSRNLRVLDLRRSSPSCFVDVVISVGQTGTLTYDCAGGGAIVDFGGATFRGAFDGTRVDVCIGTSFDWSDGCRWNSSQRIQGEPALGSLRFDYVESPAPGEHGCLTPCTATATIAIE